MDLFWCSPLSTLTCFVVQPYLYRIIVGGRERVGQILATLTLISRSQGHFKCQQYGFSALSSEQVDGF